MRSFYQLDDLYGNVIPGTSWGINIWPGETKIERHFLEPRLLKAMTQVAAKFRDIVQNDPTLLNEFDVNMNSKLGYPYYTSENKVIHVIDILLTNSIEPGIATTLTRNQVDKKGKIRKIDTLIGNVVVENKVRLDHKFGYIYDSEGEFETMRGRAAFNFPKENMKSQGVDSAVHTAILINTPSMHHDMSTAYTSPEYQKAKDYEEITSVDDLISGDPEDNIKVCTDAVRFDYQQDVPRQLAYGEGIGPVYKHWIDTANKSPFLIEGSILPNSYREIVKPNGVRLKPVDLQALAVKFGINNRLTPYGIGMSNKKFFLVNFQNMQMGSGLSLVTTLPKVLFIVLMTISRLYYRKFGPILRQTDLDEHKLSTCFEEFEEIGITLTQQPNLTWLNDFCCLWSYGDDQCWFGQRKAILTAWYIYKLFIELDVESTLSFLGFRIAKDGIYLTAYNFGRTEQDPEHAFGTGFRRFPAVALKCKVDDYKRLGNMPAAWYTERTKLLKQAGFDEESYIRDNFEQQLRESNYEPNWKNILGKYYLMTKEERRKTGVYRPVPESILLTNFNYMIGSEL
jgi:hypothetical protein